MTTTIVPNENEALRHRSPLAIKFHLPCVLQYRRVVQKLDCCKQSP